MASKSLLRLVAPLALCAPLALPMPGWGQLSGQAAQVPDAPAPQDDCGLHALGDCVRDIGQDQLGIWTSPLRMHPHDLVWVAPLLTATAISLAYDSKAQHALGVDQTRARVSNDISNLGSFYAVPAYGVGLYFLGLARKNAKLEQTGRLATEAALDAGIVDVPIKIAVNRERPNVDNAEGESWPDGTHNFTWDNSFPSGHATASWALAHVIAHQYPGLWTSLGAYGFATAVSIGRVTGEDHFPSDVLVGGALGYLVSGYVLHHRAAPSRDFSLLRAVHPIVDPHTRTLGISLQIRPGISASAPGN
jgi:membrane-associated phospholipid phosphatase